MKKNDLLMVLVVAGVAVLGAFWFLLLTPQQKKASDAKAALATAQTDLAAAQQKVTAGRQAQDDFRRDRTTILKLGRVVPETDDIPTLLTQLQALADKYHVRFDDYSVSASGGASSTSTGATTATTPTSTGTASTDATAPLFPPGSVSMSGGLGRTPIELALVGEYTDLQNYLRAVERFAVISAEHSSTTGRLMVVDAFSYALAADHPNQKIKNLWEVHPDLSATLTASVYFAPPLDAPTASATGSSSGTATPSTSTSTSTGTATIGSLR